MKPEINNENKAKFFALYWGQFIGEEYRHFIEYSTINLTDYIVLKPLSSISDEDAIELSFLLEKYFEDYEHYDVSKDQIEEFRSQINDILEETHYPLIFSDFFRSKGYALPWMGLSVDEMVETGWIKLI